MKKQITQYYCDFCDGLIYETKDGIVEYCCPTPKTITAQGGKGSVIQIQFSNGLGPTIMHFCPKCEKNISLFLLNKKFGLKGDEK